MIPLNESTLPEELFSQANVFLSVNDEENYHMYLIMAANLDHTDAETKINQLEDHLNLSPGGPEYLKLLDEWNEKIDKLT